MINQLEELKRENEESKLKLHAQKNVISRLEEELNQRGEEINDIRNVQTDYQILCKKYEALQSEMNRVKIVDNKKHILTYDKEMQLEEMKILSKLEKENFNKAEKHLRLEHENLSTRVEELERENSDLSRENERLLSKNDELEKLKVAQKREIQKKNDEFNKLQVEKQDEKSKFEKIISGLTNDKNKFSDETTKLKKELELKRKEISKLNDDIDELIEKSKQLEKKGTHFEAESNKLKNQSISSLSLLKKLKKIFYLALAREVLR